MIDFDALPEATDGLTADDFAFRIGRSSEPTTWADAPAPAAVAVRRGAGDQGGDRVTFVWPDGAIKNAWLQVTVKANARTGLAADDVFYFGSLVGETGDLQVTAVDYALVRMNAGRPAPIGSRFDFDRDGRMTAFDLLTARANVFHSLPALNNPAAAAPTASVAVAAPVLNGVRDENHGTLASAIL